MSTSARSAFLMHQHYTAQKRALFSPRDDVLNCTSDNVTELLVPPL